MLKYFKKVDKELPLPVTNPERSAEFENTSLHNQQEIIQESSELPDLPSDPGKRPSITKYHPNIRERVRRKYFLDRACQPHLKEFPQTKIDGIMRRFNRSWFSEYNWLEYSISKDAGFCLYCYLFKNELGDQGGGDTFVSKGFRDWKKKSKLRKHEGDINSAHNQTFSKCQDLINQKLFVLISNIVNVVGGSCKRKDSLREKQASKIVQALENEEIASGSGLNQESTLICPCDTRWGSHYGTILSLMNLFDSIVEVLRVIVEEGTLSNQRGEASRLIKDMLCFDFIFDLHLMKSMLGITNDLSQALQGKDQDIVNAMNLVDISKGRLQEMRDDGWSALIEDVSAFCINHGVEVFDMDDVYVSGKRPRRRVEEVTNSHRYRVEVFNTVIDTQLSELNGRFNEVNTELLRCVACLNPSNSFEAYDDKKLVKLAEFYPNEFQGLELLALPDQLTNFVKDVRANIDTLSVKGLGDISKKMVETKRMWFIL